MDHVKDFHFWSPTEFVFGRNSEARVGEMLKRYDAKNVLIHYGGGSVVRSGLFDAIITQLDLEGIRYVALGGAKPNPRSSLVYEGIELARRGAVDFVLALGGGSAIDSAKAIAAGAMYPGDFWDFYSQKAVIENALPIGVVLTIPAAGSEASMSAVITKEETMIKRGLVSRYYRPKFAIINPEQGFSIPRYHLFAGVVDMMSHIFERYLTKTPDVVLTDRMSEAVLKTIIEAARVLKDHPRDYEAMATIFWAGTIAHNGILGVGKEEDWSSHFLEHELSALYDVSHGAGLAVIFPAFMRYTLMEDVMRYRNLAVNVFGVDDDPDDPVNTALRGIETLKSFYREIGMPTHFKELGAQKKDIDRLIDTLRSHRGEVIGSFKKLSMDDVREIYLLATMEDE